jgi:DNA-directed RNA polymerase subunit H (RpoH/RPB5)/nitrate reductase NapAB chaperone NapD
MSSSKSNRILSIYKSRKNILDILQENLVYNVKDYENFSINEIDAMFTNSQLDMLLTNNNNKKMYIKYYLTAKQIRPQNLDDIIEDLFVIDNILTKEDTLVIIIDEEPNDTILNKVKYLYDHDGIFVVIHCIRRLQYNILKHKLVPECIILDNKKKEELMVKYNIKNLMQLPEISRFDPQALLLSLRPGDVCKFNRNSATSLEYEYYRVCV